MRDKGTKGKRPIQSSSKIVILISYHNVLAANLTIDRAADCWMRRVIRPAVSSLPWQDLI